MPMRSRPASGPAARMKSPSVMGFARVEHDGPASSMPASCLLKEVKLIDCRYTCKVYVDDSDHMNALMSHARPSPPPPIKLAITPEPSESTEPQVYTKSLIRSMDDAARRRKHVPLGSSPAARDAAPNSAFLVAAPDTGDAATDEKPKRPPSRPALQVWSEENQLRERRCMTAPNPSVLQNRTSSRVKGRFPHEMSTRLSDAIRSWKSEEQSLTCPDSPVLSQEHQSENHKRLDQLKGETMRSSCALSRVSPTPPPTDQALNGRRKSKDYMSEAFAERKRREFDYRDYSGHVVVGETLNKRALCRDMVIAEFLKDQEGSSVNPLVALGPMFDNGEGHSTTEDGHLDKRVKGSLWSSVWTRKANEMALERERKSLIKDIQSFKLCVAAASLSRGVVENLQAELIKTVQSWPCSYKKHHIYTQSDFESWIRKKYNLPGAQTNRDNVLQNLTECMSSSAEAAFVEYMLSVLPENAFEHQNV